jgi:hypothetical protein
MNNYWNKSTKYLMSVLIERGVVKTVRYIPGGVEFFYADRIVTLKTGEAKWFALAHIYHLEENE